MEIQTNFKINPEIIIPFTVFTEYLEKKLNIYNLLNLRKVNKYYKDLCDCSKIREVVRIYYEEPHKDIIFYGYLISIIEPFDEYFFNIYDKIYKYSLPKTSKSPIITKCLERIIELYKFNDIQKKYLKSVFYQLLYEIKNKNSKLKNYFED